MRGQLTAIALLLAAALAGCVAYDGAPATAAAGPTAQAATVNAAPAPANATGALRVLAHTPQQAPIPGVRVAVANRTAVTGANGTATLAGLPAGEHALNATRDGYRAARATVRVTPGETAVVAVALQRGEVAVPHAHDVVLEYEGYFDCSATYLIITGDCLLLVDHAANETGLPAQPGQGTNERYAFEFPLDAGWQGVVVEMFWTPTSPATGREMTLALEPADHSAQGHAPKYARAHGDSPLRVTLLPGARHATATTDAAPSPHGGEVIRTRAFVKGALHNPGGTDFLGVGATVEQRFTVYVSIFYSGAPPGSYTVQGGT